MSSSSLRMTVAYGRIEDLIKFRGRTAAMEELPTLHRRGSNIYKADYQAYAVGQQIRTYDVPWLFDL